MLRRNWWATTLVPRFQEEALDPLDPSYRLAPHRISGALTGFLLDSFGRGVHAGGEGCHVLTLGSNWRGLLR